MFFGTVCDCPACCCRNRVVRAARRRRVRHQRHPVRSPTPTVLNRRQTFSSRRHRALAPAHSSTSQVRQSRQSRQSRHRALTPAHSSTSQVRQSRQSRHRALAPARSSTSQVRQSRQSRHRALAPAHSSTSQVYIFTSSAASKRHFGIKPRSARTCSFETTVLSSLRFVFCYRCK